jgi:hypothetical protein
MFGVIELLNLQGRGTGRPDDLVLRFFGILSKRILALRSGSGCDLMW